MDMAHIPITDPNSQMDAVCDFCSSWPEPVTVSHESKKMVWMSYEYYLAHFCSEEDCEKIGQALAAHNAGQGKS